MSCSLPKRNICSAVAFSPFLCERLISTPGTGRHWLSEDILQCLHDLVHDLDHKRSPQIYCRLMLHIAPCLTTRVFHINALRYHPRVNHVMLLLRRSAQDFDGNPMKVYIFWKLRRRRIRQNINLKWGTKYFRDMRTSWNVPRTFQSRMTFHHTPALTKSAMFKHGL